MDIAKMKAVQVSKAGGPFDVVERDIPEPGRGEVRIRVEACGIASTVNGLKSRGKLLIVAAPFEPITISAFPLLSGKTIAGWPSGSAIDSEDTMRFSALTGVRPMVEVFKLEDAEAAYTKVMENRVRFRAVLTP